MRAPERPVHDDRLLVDVGPRQALDEVELALDVRPRAMTAWEGAAERVKRTLSERCRDELNAVADTS